MTIQKSIIYLYGHANNRLSHEHSLFSLYFLYSAICIYIYKSCIVAIL